jgi:putative endonuclease
MAGLDPAINQRIARRFPEADTPVMRGGWVYIMANRRYGTLYVGVTANLPRRAWEHRESVVDGFTQRYGLKLLVWAEHHDDIRSAIQREKNIKHWPRTWKIDLIETHNSEWEDLYPQLALLP